jgi:Flp pilus assembly CpaF family ATPase
MQASVGGRDDEAGAVEGRADRGQWMRVRAGVDAVVCVGAAAGDDCSRTRHEPPPGPAVDRAEVPTAGPDLQLVERLRQTVGEELNLRAADVEGSGRPALTADDRRMLARTLLQQELEQLDAEALKRGQTPLEDADRAGLQRAVIAELFELGRIQQYIDDPTVSDVAINGHDTVWLTRRDGRKVRGEPVADSDRHLIEMIQTAARRGRSEQRWDPSSPILDLQLATGDRLNAIAWVSGRPSVSIRRHDFDIHRLKQLVGLGTINEPLYHLLRAMVRARFNIIVAGGTGAGKTTLLRCLINEVPPEERLVTVEDSLELGLNRFRHLHPDLVDMEARQANVEGVGAMTMNALAINALRMNPDRLIVGEVRGDEALTLLLAATQGNDGTLCSLHADSSSGVFGRLRMYLAMTRERFEPEAANMLVAQGVDAVIHLTKLRGGPRVVTSVREVTGAEADLIMSNEIFAPDASGRAAPAYRFSEQRMVRLHDAGFDHRWLETPGRWHQ